jgi:hypothetical protein
MMVEKHLASFGKAAPGSHRFLMPLGKGADVGTGIGAEEGSPGPYQGFARGFRCGGD